MRGYELIGTNTGRGKNFIAFATDSSGCGALNRQSGPRVLIVEDDYFVAMEIERTLLDLQCDIIGIVATGEEAIASVARENPSLILMDIRLAGKLDGIDSAIEINKRFGIRSLFVTAHSDEKTKVRGENANPLGWAEKPFTAMQLKLVVGEVLSNL